MFVVSLKYVLTTETYNYTKQYWKYPGRGGVAAIASSFYLDASLDT
jgi:hypothetical protein